MTKKAGVIGNPLGHSLSPTIHNYWLDKNSIEGSYEAIELEEGDLESFINNMAAEGYAGVNVTIPYKEKVIQYLDEIHINAAAIGAVNTIVIEEGKTFGYNTDAQGFMANIQETLPELDLFEQYAVVLGSGGASRAVCVALLEEGAKIIISNRTRERAEELKKHLIRELSKTYPEVEEGDTITLVDWGQKERVISQASLLVNTTSLGMEGQPPLDIDLVTLPEDAAVADIVYNPIETQLLKKAKEQGNLTVDGIGMLLYQAEPGFYAWFGTRPEVTNELREKVLAGLK